jgi:hypothetical protein
MFRLVNVAGVSQLNPSLPPTFARSESKVEFDTLKTPDETKSSCFELTESTPSAANATTGSEVRNGREKRLSRSRGTKLRNE